MYLQATTVEPQTVAVAEPDSAAEPCCQGNCTAAGHQKYYSVAGDLFGHQHCGECCLDPKNYNLYATSALDLATSAQDVDVCTGTCRRYHFFEKNLTLSPVASPCTSLFGFTKYDSTVTHGFGPVSVTLDLYDLPNESFVSARCALPELSLLPSFGPPRNDFASVFAGSLDAGKCVDAADKAVMAKEGANLQVIPRHLWYY